MVGWVEQLIDRWIDGADTGDNDDDDEQMLQISFAYASLSR